MCCDIRVLGLTILMAAEQFAFSATAAHGDTILQQMIAIDAQFAYIFYGECASSSSIKHRLSQRYHYRQQLSLV